MVKAIKITLLSLLIVCLVGIMVSFMTGNFNFKTKSKLIYDNEFELSEIKDFDIDVRSMDVKIVESENEKVRIKIYAPEEKAIDVEKDEDGNISIKQNRKVSNVCVGFCFNQNTDITIYLPKEYDGKFNIKATSGDITSEVKNYLSYDINVTSGDVELKNVDSLTGKTTSGDVEIENIKSYIKYKTTSGDFEIDSLTITKDSYIEATSGDVDIDETSNIYVNATAKSGDIKIKNNDRHAEYELNIKTTSGDITVK